MIGYARTDEVVAEDGAVCSVCRQPIEPGDEVSALPHARLHAACAPGCVLADPPTPPNRPSAQKLVLVVDDNDDHRTMYAICLEAAGYRVAEAADGTSAVGKARALRPDVILLDLVMPGLNGWQACRWLKSSAETVNIPVVVLTAHGVAPAERQAIEAGCDRFLVKGTNPEIVIETIRDVLAR